MVSCTRCHSINCRGGAMCTSGACKTCGRYACKGNCSTPIGFYSGKNSHKGGLLRCAVCGETYSNNHSSVMCDIKIRDASRKTRK